MTHGTFPVPPLGLVSTVNMRVCPPQLATTSDSSEEHHLHREGEQFELLYVCAGVGVRVPKGSFDGRL